MKQTMCPYCDQKMTFGHYCTGCRRFVKTPYTQDVTYYLNQRHPVHEADCTYHQTEQQVHAKKYTGTKQTSAGRTLPEGMHHALSRGLPVLIVVLFLFLQAMPVILSFVESNIDMSASDLRRLLEQEAGADFTELTDEEVVAGGLSCTGYQHFQVTREEMRTKFDDVLSKYGFEIDSEESYTHNEKDSDGTTWYNSSDYIYLNGPDSAGVGNQYIIYEYDTATGQLHSVDVVADNAMQAVTLAKAMAVYIDQQEKYTNADELKKILDEQFLTSMSEEKSFDLNYGSVWVEGSVVEENGEGECTYIMISPATLYN